MKKGFTLMELLAVIILIAVITLITVPMIFTYIGSSKKKAFESGVQNVFDAVNAYISTNENFKEININDSKLNLKNSTYISGYIYVNSEGTLIAENISDGKYCASGEKNDLNIESSNNTSLPCSGLDNTPPTLELMVNSRTTNSITILAEASDRQSGILGYSYSTDNKNWSKIQDNQIITISNLKKGEEVTIYVKVYNINYDGSNETATSTMQKIVASSSNVDEINFEVTTNESNSVKVVNIIYPVGDNYKYYYSTGTNESDFIETTNEKTSVVVKENSVLTAKVIFRDGTFIKNTFEISGIDITGPKAKVSFNSNYEKAKKVVIDILEEQTGLQSKTYSFDGGKTWQIENFKMFGSNVTLTDKIVVRDKLGNLNKEFTVCIDDVCGSSTNTINITKIDSTPPTATWTYNAGTATVTCVDTESGISDSAKGTTFAISGNADVTKTYICSDKAGNLLATSKTFIYNSCLTGSISCVPGYDVSYYQYEYSCNCHESWHCSSGCGKCYGNLATGPIYGCELDGGRWVSSGTSCDSCTGTGTTSTYNACKTLVNTCAAGFTMK